MTKVWERREADNIDVIPLFEDLGFYLEYRNDCYVVGFYDIDHSVPLPGYITTFGIEPGDDPKLAAQQAISEFLRSEADKFYADQL